MSINLEFTKNPQWIQNREYIWEQLKLGYSSELTRKQRETLHQYFLTGAAPENLEDINQFAYIDLFPLQTREGLFYCFKEFFDPMLGGVRSDWQNYIWMLYANKRYDLDRESAVTLFELFCGERFSSNKKFPFLAKNEVEYRDMLLDARSMLSRFINAIRIWISSSDSYCPVQVYLIEYMFSIFSHVDNSKLYFVVPLPPASSVDANQKSEINDTIEWCKRIHEFLKIFVSKKITENSEEERNKKVNYINKVSQKLDEMTAPEYPQTLIDHWQWVKEGGKLRSTPPPIKV
jgi:hypothetical protein